MPNARIYLRASTSQQDADRARADVEALAAQLGLDVVGTYLENESGAKLDRPELFRLLADSRPGDVLLIEQVDRLSRLTDADWRRLRAAIDTRGRQHEQHQHYVQAGTAGPGARAPRRGHTHRQDDQEGPGAGDGFGARDAPRRFHGP